MSRSLSGLALLALAVGATAAPGGANEFFVSHPDSRIQMGSTAGNDLSTLIDCWCTPRGMVMEGDDLLVGTAEGFIMRFERATGNFLYDYTIGIDVSGMAWQEGTLLIGTLEAEIHRYDTTSGLVADVYNPQFPVSAVHAWGDRIISGSTNGLVEIGDPVTDTWQVLGASAAGGVKDLQVAGKWLFVATARSSRILKYDLELGVLATSFDAGEQPMDLELDGEELLIGTDLGSVLSYDVATDTFGPGFDAGAPVFNMVVHPTQPLGTEFCGGVACPCANDAPQGGCANSTGAGAHLEAAGTSKLSVGDVQLTARDLPPQRFGLIFMSQASGSTPAGDGQLCAAVAGQSVYRFPTRSTGVAGILQELEVAVHAAEHFGPDGLIEAGDTWNFQAWFRDPGGPCGGGFNTSNAVAIGFTE